MVAYLKLLSTVLSRGLRSKECLYLSGQVLQIKQLPDMSVEWNFTVNEYISARYGHRFHKSYKSTWGSDNFGIKLRNIRTNIRANREASLIDNEHSLFFHVNGKRLDLSVHLNSVDVLDALPYWLAAIGLVWRVLSYETKVPLGNLTVLIGHAWIPKAAMIEAKTILIGPVPKTQTVTIKKTAGRNFAVKNFNLINQI